LIELDEILGYHLEQSHRYRIDLGLGGAQTVELARRASKRLATAGERAFVRGDDTGAAALLARALALLALDERPISLVSMLSRSRFRIGQIPVALGELETLIERAEETGDRARELRVRLAHAWIAYFGGGMEPSEAEALVEEALSFFTERRD